MRSWVLQHVRKLRSGSTTRVPEMPDHKPFGTTFAGSQSNAWKDRNLGRRSSKRRTTKCDRWPLRFAVS